MFLRLLIASCLAASTAGCAGVGPLASSRYPYPVYGNPVNPTPAPGYRVICQTNPGVDFLLFSVFTSGCEQVIVPPEVVVRARG